MKNLQTNYSLSPIDERDYSYGVLSKGVDTILPESFELDYKLKVKDQKDSMACVGHSVSAAMEIALGSEEHLSQWWIYHNRNLQSIEENPFPGYYNRCALSHASKEGVPFLREYNNAEEVPDGIFSLLKVKDALMNKAAKHKVETYFKINSIDELKKFIYEQKCPAILSMAIYDSCAYVGPDGNIPKCEGELQGYHSVCILGWKKDRLVMLNSVSDKWGDNGKGYLLTNDDKLIQEMWGVTTTEVKSTVKEDNVIKKVGYRVQVGAFKSKHNAEALCKALAMNGIHTCPAYKDGWYKVQCGYFENINNRDAMITKLKGLGYTDIYVEKVN